MNLAVGRIRVCGAIYNMAFTADGFHAHHITRGEPWHELVRLGRCHFMNGDRDSINDDHSPRLAF